MTVQNLSSDHHGINFSKYLEYINCYLKIWMQVEYLSKSLILYWIYNNCFMESYVIFWN